MFILQQIDWLVLITTGESVKKRRKLYWKSKIWILNLQKVVWTDKVGSIPAGKQHTLSVEKIVQTADPKFVLTLGKDGFIRRLDVANNALE